MLSVVIPAYNEEARLPETLAEIAGALPGAEVVVVDDGSRDATAAVATALGARVVRHSENRGKGAAVRSGLAAARGDLVLVVDADLPTPLSCLHALIEAVQLGADLAIGSRGLKGSAVFGRSRARKLAALLFNFYVRLLTGLPYRDTQCGFKLFTVDAAKRVSSLLVCSGYAYDVEMLVIARRLGLKVAEVPVAWHSRPGSKVKVLRDGLKMASAVAGIAWRERECFRRKALLARRKPA